MKGKLLVALAALSPVMSAVAFDTGFAEDVGVAAVTLSGYDGAETLTNFPARIRFSAEAFPGLDAYLLSEDGADVRVTDTNGTELAFEVERWDPAGESLVWVKIPELRPAAEAATTVLVTWGGTAARTTRPQDVWTDYAAVFHMNAATLDDATGNGYALAGSGSLIDGPAGKAIEHAASLSMPDFVCGADGIGSNYTVSCWYRFPAYSSATAKAILQKGGWVANGRWYTQYKGSYTSMGLIRDHGDRAKIATKDVRTEWNYHAVRNDGGAMAAEANGGDWTSFGTLALDDDYKLVVGGTQVDELRIMRRVASAAWMRADYLTQSDAAFATGTLVRNPVFREVIVRYASGTEPSVGDDRTLTIPYRVASTGGSAVDVHVRYAIAGDAVTNDVVAATVGAAMTEDANLTVADLFPGTNYVFAIYGVNRSGAASDATSAKTLPVPGAPTFDGLARVQSKTAVTLAGTVRGAGAKSATLLYAFGDAAWSECALALNADGAFSVTLARTSPTDVLRWKVAAASHLVSATWGTFDWQAESSEQTSADTADVTYTWNGSASDDWSDADNWTPDAAACYGFPDSAHATARFAASGRVSLRGARRTVATDGLSFAKGVRATIAGGELSSLSSAAFGASGATVTLENMTNTFSSYLTPCSGTTIEFLGNCRVRGGLRPWGTGNVRLVFRDGETVFTGKFEGYNNNPVTGNEFLVSNAVVRLEGSGTGGHITGMVSRFVPGQDREARLVVNGNLSVGSSGRTAGEEFSFTVPETGLASAPIRAIACAGTSYPGTFTVDVTDWKRGRRVPLVTFTSATEQCAVTNSLTLVTVPAAAQAERRARLEWSGAENTLYYVQDGPEGFLVAWSPAAETAAPAAETVGLALSFTADGYAPGEVLSQKGTSGATWSPLPAGATATGVVAGASAAIAVATSVTNGAALVADAPTDTNAFRRIDFRIATDILSDEPAFAPDAVAALVPGLAADGEACFFGWGGDAWRELRSGTGATVTPSATNGWVDVRIELKTVGGTRYASYLVADGGTWTRLRTSGGRAWFATRSESVRMAAAVAGRGRLASLAAADDPTATPTTYYWIGGASGDWSAAANWSLAPGGTAAAKAPDAANEAGVVAGTVEILRDGAKTVVRDAVVAFDADGAGEMIGGSVGGAPTLDTDRPLAGRPMTVVTPQFFGCRADYAYRWFSGDYGRTAFAVLGDGDTYAPEASDCERWLRVVATEGSVPVWTNEFYFSRLPVAYMTTDDGEMPGTNRAEHAGTIRIQGGERYAFQYDGDMVIKARGNTSLLHFEKKPYKIKLASKANLFGMGKQKHWVLLANSDDRTNLRNKLAYDLAGALGGLAMDSTWLVCFLNGNYRGLYQIAEHIRPDDNRVPVYDWEDAAGKVAEKFAGKYALSDADADLLTTQLETNLAWVTEDRVTYVTNGVVISDRPSSLWKKFTDDITGGYILEFSAEYDEVSKFTTFAGNLRMKTMINKPEYLLSNDEMFGWVRDLMQDYWNACTSSDRCVPSGAESARAGLHYSEFCDVDSMAVFTLVNELFTNQDACQKSRYAYVQDGRLTWGPVWDFDHGSASYSVCTTENPRGVTNRWIAAQSANRNSMIAEWSADFFFCRKLHALYWRHRDRYAQIVAAGGGIDEATNYIAEAALANDARWSNSTRKFVSDLGYLRRNLTDRLDWLDRQFASVTNLVESFRSAAQSAPSTWDPEAKSEPMTDARGREVPAVPLEWVRAANVGADASYAYAGEARLKAAVTNAPSLRGKATPLWEDYVAGTNPDPNGTNAVFEVTSFAVTNGVPHFRWTPDLGARRAYRILGCGKPGEAWHAREEGDRFFRVEVSMPK